MTPLTRLTSTPLLRSLTLAVTSLGLGILPVPWASADSAPPPLVATPWQLVAYRSGPGAVTATLAGTTVTATFDPEGRVTGSAGCNAYGASYTLTAPDLTIGPGVSSRMFCHHPEGIMTQEQDYLQALAATATYDWEGDRLTLRSADGSLIAQFVPLD